MESMTVMVHITAAYEDNHCSPQCPSMKHIYLGDGVVTICALTLHSLETDWTKHPFMSLRNDQCFDTFKDGADDN